MPWAPLNADPRLGGCLVGRTYFVRIPVPPDVARDLPPVTVLSLEDVRRMLQESEAEDGARQSGTVDRLRGNRPSRIQFEEMD